MTTGQADTLYASMEQFRFRTDARAERMMLLDDTQLWAGALQ